RQTDTNPKRKRGIAVHAQKSPIVSPPLIDRIARHVARTILSLTNRTEPSANSTCTPPAWRLREAQVSVPVAAAAHGRNWWVFETGRQPWDELGQRSGNLLLGASSANRN